MKTHLRRRLAPVLLGWLCLLTAGCIGSSVVSGLIGDCGDLSFSDVQQQNGLSDTCRDAITSLLPDAQNNFTSRLVLLGADTNGTGQRILYLQGINTAGTGLTAADFSVSNGAVVTVTQAGVTTTLPASDFTVSSLSAETDGIASLSLVTDYSASMSGDDIDAAGDIFNDVLDVVPSAILESEVSVFSDTVTVRREFSEDETAVRAAIVRDDDIERNSTALYDGMGAALTRLIARDRPIRILVVSTDGLENASESFTKAGVIGLIEDNRVLTVMIGTLLSDVSELQDLAGRRGVFFYAQSYFDAREQMAAFYESLQNASKITLNAAYQNADSISIQAQGLTLETDL